MTVQLVKERKRFEMISRELRIKIFLNDLSHCCSNSLLDSFILIG